jgi:large subunit ribosomal protein L30
MATAKKTIKVEQVASPLRRDGVQRKTLVGLGLNKIGRVKDLPDTPSTHGMIRKVRHLVRTVDSAK